MKRLGALLFSTASTALLIFNIANAAETIVSNFTFAITPGSANGEVLVLSRGDADNANGYTDIQLTASNGKAELISISQAIFPKDIFGVNDHVFDASTAENRRSLSVRVGSSFVAQGFGNDSNKATIVPTGLVRVLQGDASIFDVTAAGFNSATIKWPSPLDVSAHSIVVDQGKRIWLARGPWGLVKSKTAPDQWVSGVAAINDSVPLYLLNPTKSQFDTVNVAGTNTAATIDTTSHLPIWALTLDSTSGQFWIGSEKGLWKGSRDSSQVHRISLGGIDTLRITGIWTDSIGKRIFVESSARQKDSKNPVSNTTSSLWRSTDGGVSFTSLNLPYDSLDLSISAVAFVGNEAWLSVQGIENDNVSGLLRITSSGAIAWPDSLRMSNRSAASNWIWGLEAGVVDRDVLVTSVGSFPLGTGVGLAVSTWGAGISVSADSGKTWKPILNQSSVKANLAEVRMTPSVMRITGATTQIAYRLGQASKVSIDVFSYDMRVVRNIVRNADRAADPLRSSDARYDVWDGKDDAGNPVTLGVYFVRVRDNHGHDAWGKVMWLGGAR